MRISLKPKSTMGKWSIGMIIAFFLFFVVFLILVASGQRGYTIFSNLVLTIPKLLAGVSGTSALVTGIIGIAKSREWSVLVFLATAIGLFVLIFSLGEILFPH